MRVRLLLAILALTLASALAACTSSAGPRHIVVSMTDEMTFQPPTITVRQGETVVFDVTNLGLAAHEFYIGAGPDQADHEIEMQKMGAMGHDHATGVHVAGGAMKPLRMSFPAAGNLEIGCHEPGHWAAGMKGTLTIQP